MRLIDDVRKLNFKDGILLAETLFLLWIVRIMLWILPFSVIEKFVKKNTVAYYKANSHKLSVEKITWAVIVMSKYVLRCTCLNRVLAAQILLARRNYHSYIKLGVNKDNKSQLDAHAWLEIDGEIVLGESDREYIPILNLGE